jgi:plasmid stabilization system protein ParE
MAKIVWTQTALKQLERIVKFIEQEQGPSVARTVGERIIDRSEHLEKFPEMGVVEQLLAHKKFQYRFLVVWSYKIIYRVTKNRITISRVFHTAQNPKRLRGS